MSFKTKFNKVRNTMPFFNDFELTALKHSLPSWSVITGKYGKKKTKR